MRKIVGAVYLVYGLIVFFAGMFAVLPFVIITSFISGRAGTNIPFFFLRCWAYFVSVITFFPVLVRRNKNVDPGKAYIYVSNHNSYLDSPAVVISTPNAFKPLGKIEMTKIPVFGWIYERVVVMIDRSSKESRAASVEQLKEVLRNGTSILIFPEGTMNTGSDAVKEFYDGAFRIAIESQTPIAPFVIINARNLLPRNAPLMIRPGIVKSIFADPVDVSGYTIEQLPELKEKVHRIMTELILKNQ